MALQIADKIYYSVKKFYWKQDWTFNTSKFAIIETWSLPTILFDILYLYSYNSSAQILLQAKCNTFNLSYITVYIKWKLFEPLISVESFWPLYLTSDCH